MRQFFAAAATVGGFALLLSPATATAGTCGVINGLWTCQPQTVVMPHQKKTVDPVVVHSGTSYDHLRSVHYSNTPHVNITRIHGQPDTVRLTDAPSGFSGGCNPHSTKYCRHQTMTLPPKAAIMTPGVAVAGQAHIAQGSPRAVSVQSHSTARVSGAVVARPHVPTIKKVQSVPQVHLQNPAQTVEVAAPPATRIQDGGGWKNISGLQQIRGHGYVAGMPCQPMGVPVSQGGPVLPYCSGPAPQLAGGPKYGNFSSRYGSR